MRLVVADTGPVNYLLLIGHIEILPALFDKVILPSVVGDELAKPNAPLPVRNWIASPPAWVENTADGRRFRTTHLSRGSTRAKGPQ